jgi:hypothetical protein
MDTQRSDGVSDEDNAEFDVGGGRLDGAVHEGGRPSRPDSNQAYQRRGL